MRYLTLLLCLLATVLHAQEKDRRAVLEIKGNVGELSVSPDEKIWLTTNEGEIYFTNSIDSNWHYTKNIEHKDNNIFNSDFKRISFFNKDTAILTGIIRYDSIIDKYNGYYLTTNAGKTWELRNYGGESWIYTVRTDSFGNAWMSGNKNELYISSDFGHTWKTVKLSFKNPTRPYLCMKDSQSGIMLSDDDEILSTLDNWKTKHQIPEKKDSLYRTNPKIAYWKNYLLMYNGGFYYTDTQTIDWKKFPLPIIDFEYDRISDKLFAISDSFHVLLFSSLTQYKRITKKPFEDSPYAIKAQNGALYLLFGTEDIYRVTENSFKKNTICTYDKPIAQPKIVRKGQTYDWGVSTRHLYISNAGSNDWYREAILHFWVYDCKLINDSTAILWDGIYNNYLYSLHNHRLTPYIVHHPIQSFLSAPVKSFNVQFTSSGCFHHSVDTMDYLPFNDSIFIGQTHPYRGKNKLPAQYADIRLLNNILANIDKQPHAKPSIQDFRITQKDKENYQEFIMVEQNKPNYFREKRISQSEYQAALKALDTINNNLLAQILNRRSYRSSTESRTFHLSIINTTDDTLQIKCRHYQSPKAWNLPWDIEYKHLHFTSNSIQLSQFISTSVSDSFIDTEPFDNKFLIKQIADYLYGVIR